MEGTPPSTSAMPGAMHELKTVDDASEDDYCPYPPAPGDPWWLKAILLLLLPYNILARAFKWYPKQRVHYAILENLMLTLVPYFLDAQRIVKKTPFLGPYAIRKLFERVQNFVPYPPQHLMSSAPSNSPGILTVLKRDSKLVDQCKYKDKDILTSDDFPVLPAQPRIFRTVDGFGNCPYSPHIGQAAQPYSFVALCKKPEVNREGKVIEKKLPSTKDVFDKLFKREKFKANEAGLNCLILDFATLLTHDLFNSHNGYNENSSYADLSPLYGHDADAARRVRVFKRGLLDLKKVPSSRSGPVKKGTNDQSAGDAGLQAVDKKDKKDLAGYAAEWNWDWGFVGWRALVEVFAKEHNHVARKLLEWYPEKFSHEFVKPFKQEELGALYDKDGLSQDNAALKGHWINDEALYQTARYITTRIYGNIVVTDYASNFLGLKELNDFFLGRPEKLGNCCSYEFGLLYHWHCLLPDDSPDAEQPRGVPCNLKDEKEKDLSKRGPLPGDYYDQLSKVKPKAYERTCSDLMDSKKVKLDDYGLPDTELELDDLLLARYNTRIGRFGAFHTPEYLRHAEMRTMETARTLGVGSYNDFRAHLNLMRCVTYEEINPDPKVANVLRELYGTDHKGNDNADNVELYPGVFAERSGYNGIKFGNILSLGLLEDALNLIRNDRLFVDFDAATATPKGYQHAVSSHLADIIERNTGLKLVKQVMKEEGPEKVEVEVEAKYGEDYERVDWQHWRLASAALLTVPDEEGTVRKEIFKDAKSKPGRLAKWPQAAQKKSVPKVSVPDTSEDASTPTSVINGLNTPPY